MPPGLGGTCTRCACWSIPPEDEWGARPHLLKFESPISMRSISLVGPSYCSGWFLCPATVHVRRCWGCVLPRLLQGGWVENRRDWLDLCGPPHEMRALGLHGLSPCRPSRSSCNNMLRTAGWMGIWRQHCRSNRLLDWVGGACD